MISLFADIKITCNLVVYVNESVSLRIFCLHLRPRIRRLTTSACFRKTLKTRSPHSNCGLICRVSLNAFSPPSPTDFTLLRCFEFSQNLKKSPPDISSWPLGLDRGYSLSANSLQKTSWKSNNKMQSIKRWPHEFISDSWISLVIQLLFINFV